ncbi:kinase-like domain-containing protein [Pavlovales sp. CCMP2436]|nr:kinase-like domain-containing protein [Pavlovales sp. CCMP2436]
MAAAAEARSGGSAFRPCVELRDTDTSEWWPSVRASSNPAARLTAGLGLLDDARRRRGVSRGPHAPCVAERVLHDAGGHVRCTYDMPFLAGRYRYMRTLDTGVTARTIVCADLFRHRDEEAAAARGRLACGAPGHGGGGSLQPLLHPLVVLKVFSSGFFAIGEQESERLRRLNAADPRAEQRVVRQLGRFVLDGRHFVIVLPLLSPLPLPPPGAPSPAPLAHVRYLAANVLLGLAFLHARGVIHADLKPDNLMLDAAADADGLGAGPEGASALLSRPTLIDFGSACTPSEARAYADGALQTLAYRAPELVYGLAGVTPAIDLWSVGCLLFELAASERLFTAASPPDLAVEIAHLLGRPPASYAAGSRTAQLAPRVAPCDPTRARPAVALALGRRLLRSGQPRRRAAQLLTLAELVASLLEYEPAARASARDALLHPFVCAHTPFAVLLPPAAGEPAPPAAPPAAAGAGGAPADARAPAAPPARLAKRETSGAGPHAASKRPRSAAASVKAEEAASAVERVAEALPSDALDESEEPHSACNRSRRKATMLVQTGLYYDGSGCEDEDAAGSFGAAGSGADSDSEAEVQVIGPIEAKLNTIKPIREIVIGAFGEVSAGTHKLVKEIAAQGCRKMYALMGVSPMEVTARIKKQLIDTIGTIAARGHAQLLLARLSALAPIAAQRGNTTNSNQQIISLNALARAHYRRSIGTRGGAQASAAD